MKTWLKKRFCTENSSSSGRLFGADLIRNPDGTKYMRRIWFGPVRLHCFYSGDLARDPHDHPFWFITIPLNRSYVENRWRIRINSAGEPYYSESKPVVVKRWRPHFRPPKYTHRVLGAHQPMEGDYFQWVQKPIWTLVIIGRVNRDWGFWKMDDKQRVCWVSHKTYSKTVNEPCG